MGLNDGISNKKGDTDLDDEGGFSVGVTTIGSTVGGGGGGGGGGGDDDLTNLTWLQDRNLLKSMTSVTSGTIHSDKVAKGRDGGGFDLLDDQFGSDESDSDDACGDNSYSKDNIVHFIKEANENVYPDDDDEEDEDDEDDVCSSPEDESNNNNTKSNDGSNLPCSVPPVPYNPKIHVHAKPPYSFSSLIFMAIESSPSKALPVKDIYAWIVEHFPYYQNSPSGWKNTVRHNLSLNKCFKKLDKGKDELVPIVGKGSLWCVDPDLRPNLLQAVRRTPAHIYPYMSTAKTNFKITPINELSSCKNRGLNDSRKILTFDQVPQIGNSPLLGKRLLIPIINRESEETDAAQSMLTLTRYNSEESRSLITDVKCEPSDKTLDDNDDDNSTIYNNPTSDHNYFSRSNETKKQNIKLLHEAQQLINLESTTKLTTINTTTIPTPSIINPIVKVIPTCLTTLTKKPQQLIPTTTTTTLATSESDLMEKVTIDNNNGRKSRGIVLMKRKVDVNDEDGLKGAQALLNLATRGLESKTKDDKQNQHQTIQQQQQQQHHHHHHPNQQQLTQSSITLPLSPSSSVKNIIDNVTNNSVDINSIGMIKKRRERSQD